MLLTSHIRGHLLSLKNRLQHCTQWLKKDINASINYSTYNNKIHQKGKKLYTWFKNQSAKIHQWKRAHSVQNVQANTTLSMHCAQDA
jgi:hypothetical protein